jgi:chlorobactene glucosyltransferase
VAFQQYADLIPALPWLFPFFTIPRLARRQPDLAQARLASGRFVSIIVPARNEAGNVGQLIGSLLRTEYQPFELIVVDDRSTDNTAGVIETLAPDDRVQLVRGEELPTGWLGKPWACVQGYRQARGDILLFTDADTRHHPELLPRAVGRLQDIGADMLTISPTQRCVTFWERVIMPQIWFLLSLRYHPRSVSQARRPRDVIANGQFILTTRAAYETAGTHAAVRHEVAEDLALAQTYVRRGLRLHFAFAEDLMETRMYQGLHQLIEGWSKNVYLGGRQSFPDEPIRRSLVPLILTSSMLFWLIPPGLAMAALMHPAFAGLLEAGLLGTGLSIVFWMLICYGMKIPARYGVGYLIGVIGSLYIILRSTWRGGGKVEWRGRTYRDLD